MSWWTAGTHGTLGPAPLGGRAGPLGVCYDLSSLEPTPPALADGQGHSRTQVSDLGGHR